MPNTTTAPRKRAGRPAGPPEERCQTLSITLKPRHLTALEREADRKEISISAAARRVFDRFVETCDRLIAEGRESELDALLDAGNRMARVMAERGLNEEEILRLVDQIQAEAERDERAEV